MATIDLPDRYGFEILRTEVGSTLHGTGLGVANEDHDEMGIAVEWPASTIGLSTCDHYVKRTAPKGQRSQPGDTDLVVYSLRKWTRLALSGNPSVLLPLFAPPDKIVQNTPHGDDLRNHAEWFASKRAGRAFLGYMERQRQRMIGERGTAGRVRVMPDGQVDWKYAMHMVRLGLQGVEFLNTGNITLPMPGNEAEELRAIRRGEVDLDYALRWSEALEQSLKRGLDGASPLPDFPAVESAEAWCIATTLAVWREHGALS